MLLVPLVLVLVVFKRYAGHICTGSTAADAVFTAWCTPAVQLTEMAREGSACLSHCAAQGLGTDNKHEAAARQLVGNLSKERTAELAKARQEAAAAREEGEALRAKMEAALSRRKVVEAEVG